jgi:hypothetical protein
MSKSKRNIEFFVPAVACNRRHIEKSNKHSAHLVVFFLSHAREEDGGGRRKSSFLLIHPYVLVRSLTKNAQLSPAARMCI